MTFPRRLVSAAVLLLPIAWMLFWAPDAWGSPVYCAFASVAFVIGAWETTALLARCGLPSHRWLAIVAVALHVLRLWLPRYVPALDSLPSGSRETLGLLGLLFCGSLSISVLRGDVEGGWPKALATAGTFLYAGVLGGAWIRLRTDLGAPFLAEGLLITWMVDTGALLVGKYFGRTKLAPLVSPQKTVEGMVGGIVTAALVTMGAKAIWPVTPGTYGEIAGLSLLLGCLSHLGDLSESLLKRKAQVKDSSNLIPGHGGILDKLDALLFVGPVYFLVARWMLRA